jgi:hypothetical protein
MSLGFVEFAKAKNVFDTHTGCRDLPFEVVDGVSVQDIQSLSEDLVQTRWRPSTRALYQGWLRLWLALCVSAGVPALPIVPELLVFFITHLALTRGSGTVAIAASAVIAFCALNDVSNPFDTSPLAKSCLIGVKKARSGPRVAEKDGVSAEFVVRLWRLRMGKWQQGALSFVEARSWFVVQLGWEGAHRPGELSGASMCDLVLAVWADKQAVSKFSQKQVQTLLRDLPSEEGDMLSLARLAKNDRKVKGQQTRLVVPERVETPSAVWLWRNMWRPFLHKMGFRISKKCGSSSDVAADLLRVHRCEHCPPLFPTLPSPTRKVVRQGAVSVQSISDIVREAAKEVDMSHLELSGKSLRIGGYSAATEDGEESTAGLAAAELRWASKTVPERVYKRRTVQEQRVKGLRQIEALERAVVPAASVSAPGSVSAAVAVRVQVKCEYAMFPMGVSWVDGVEVCRRFQFGKCPHSVLECQYRHVCHVHGKAHGVCREASALAAAWLRAQGKMPVCVSSACMHHSHM